MRVASARSALLEIEDSVLLDVEADANKQEEMQSKKGQAEIEVEKMTTWREIKKTRIKSGRKQPFTARQTKSSNFSQAVSARSSTRHLSPVTLKIRGKDLLLTPPQLDQKQPEKPTQNTFSKTKPTHMPSKSAFLLSDNAIVSLWSEEELKPSLEVPYLGLQLPRPANENSAKKDSSVGEPFTEKELKKRLIRSRAEEAYRRAYYSGQLHSSLIRNEYDLQALQIELRRQYADERILLEQHVYCTVQQELSKVSTLLDKSRMDIARSTQISMSQASDQIFRQKFFDKVKRAAADGSPDLKKRGSSFDHADGSQMTAARSILTRGRSIMIGTPGGVGESNTKASPTPICQSPAPELATHEPSSSVRKSMDFDHTERKRNLLCVRISSSSLSKNSRLFQPMASPQILQSKGQRTEPENKDKLKEIEKQPLEKVALNNFKGGARVTEFKIVKDSLQKLFVNKTVKKATDITVEERNQKPRKLLSILGKSSQIHK